MIGRVEASWARKRNCEICHKDKSPRKFLRIDGYVASFWSTCQDCRPWVPEKRNRGTSTKIHALSIDEQIGNGAVTWAGRPSARRWSGQATRKGYALRRHSRYGVAKVTRIILDGEHDAYGEAGGTPYNTIDRRSAGRDDPQHE